MMAFIDFVGYWPPQQSDKKNDKGIRAPGDTAANT